MLPKIQHLFRLVKDPELKTTPGGLQICSLYLAASEKYKDKETKLFIGATAFSKTAEFIASVRKGQRIFCTGKIQTDSWTNQQGEQQSRITMIIDSFEYVEKRDDNYQQPQQQQPQPQQYQPQGNADDFSEDIPF